MMVAMRFLRASLLLAFPFLICLGATCRSAAQTTESEILSKYQGKTLFLRGLWTCGRISFHADGQVVKDCHHGPVTEVGFLLDSVKLNGSGLRLDGHRQTFDFDNKGHLQPKKTGGKVRIDIEGKPGQDYGVALAAAIASDLGELAPSLPEAWQRWALVSAGRPAPEYGSGIVHMADRKSRGTHKGVVPPKVLHAADPQFSDQARHEKYSGEVEVYLVVDENGRPQHISIARPTGHGLDESALEAVSKYRFQPATRDGQPVAVDIFINVNFQIF